MATIDIKDVAGKTVKSVELTRRRVRHEPNIHVMHTVVRAYRAGLASAALANTQDPWSKFAAAARSRGVRRAPVVPARVPSAPLSGLAAAPCSVPTSAFLRVPA